MVALGYDSYGRTSNVEVIDLVNPGMICQDLPEYHLGLVGASAFLNFEEEPEICGGYDGVKSYKAIVVVFFKSECCPKKCLYNTLSPLLKSCYNCLYSCRIRDHIYCAQLFVKTVIISSRSVTILMAMTGRIATT